MAMSCPFVTRALEGEPVVDIGQLPKETKRELNRLVRVGRLAKSKRHWDTLSTIAGLGRPRDCWHSPGFPG